jgi:adenosylcobinamide-GDP ribazoletransferase
MLATVWLTGAFHEDGLADTCDGLGGAVSRERALAIMKDSRIGTYGAIGLVLALGVKAAALTALVEASPLRAGLALAWGHAASRLAAVGLMGCLPYGGDAEHAKAKPLATSIRATDFWVALGWVAAISLALFGFAAAAGQLASIAWSLGAAMVGIGLVVWRAVGWLGRRLGGYTGDTLGAVQQVAELVSLLCWLAVAQQLELAH